MDMTPEQLNSTVGDLSGVVPQLARLLSDSVQADRGAVFVYSSDQASTIALFRYGYPEDQEGAHRWTNEFGPVEIPAEKWVIEHKLPLHRTCPEDFEQFPLVNPGQEVREGRHVDVTIPLIWDDRVQGSACIWRSHQRDPFTEDEIDRLMDLGRVVAMTIVFARGYDEERLQRSRLDSLLEVASAVSSGREADQVFEVLVRSIRQATGSDVCTLYLYDNGGADIHSQFQDGMLETELDDFQTTQFVSLYDVPAELRLMRTREPLIVRDYRNQLSANTPLTQRLIREGISEILLLPVFWQEESLGVIYL